MRRVSSHHKRRANGPESALWLGFGENEWRRVRSCNLAVRSGEVVIHLTASVATVTNATRRTKVLPRRIKGK